MSEDTTDALEAAQGMQDVQDASAQAEAEGTPKPRRKRAKKAEATPEQELMQLVLDTQEAQVAVAQEEVPKPKPRGRKKAQTQVPTQAEVEAPVAEAAQINTDDAQPASSAEAPAEASSPEAEESKETKPRGRRPRKTHLAVAKDDVQEDASQEDSASSEASTEDDSQDDTQDSETQDQDTSASQNDSDVRGGRRRKRRAGNNNREILAPSVTREQLAELSIPELKEKAAELEVDFSDLKKKSELANRLFEKILNLEGFVIVHGILDIMSDGYGFIRTTSYLPGENDIYVATSFIKRNGLRRGDEIVGYAIPPREKEKYGALHFLETINGITPEESKGRVRFSDLTPIFPDERLVMEHAPNAYTARVIDLVAPIGKGQRGLIVSPPKAGKTTILKDIAAAISANNPDVHLMCLLVDERPEEVTDMERSINGEVISSTFDMPCENHITVAELVIERAKRLVELGKDVVILLDSITRLARAYNLGQPASGRILSGGVDSTALYPPKRFLGAARNIEFGGSLTILASALIDTGSKMDEVIFEEFKGTGNMELKLDRALADRRIFPAIDPISSGTRKEELLMDSVEQQLVWGLRRVLSAIEGSNGGGNVQKATSTLIENLKQTQTNQEFLVRAAKKSGSTNLDL